MYKIEYYMPIKANLLQLLKTLYWSLGPTVISLFLIDYCTHIALEKILLKQDFVVPITSVIVSAGVSWTVVLGSIGGTKLRQIGWYYTAAFFSVIPYTVFTFYRLPHSMMNIALLKAGMNIVVAYLAAKILLPRIDNTKIGTKEAILFASANVGITLGVIFLLWVTPLVLIMK